MGNIQNKKISTTNVPSSSSSLLSLSSSSTLTRKTTTTTTTPAIISKTTTTPTIITSTITTSTVITTTSPTSSNLSSSTITTSLNNNKQQQQQQKDKINKKNSTKVNDYIITKVQEQIPLSSSSTTISTITNNNNNNNSSIKYKHHQTGETGTTLTTSRSFTNFSQSRQNKPKNKSTIIIIKSKSLNDNKLTTVNNLSKTYWPIPYLELIFLPHFQINRKPIEDQYNLIHLLAKGAFGDVYKVIDPKSQKIFALKVLNKAQIINDVGVQQLKDEVDIQKICGHHPFIVQGLSYWQNHRKIYLLSDYVARGELFENIIHFSYELIQIYIAELALALDFLHNAGVIYRDLKPENILLDEHYHIQLIDFGLSKWLKIGGLTKTICGTLQYMVFELSMEGCQVDEAIASIFHTVLFHRSLGKFIYTADTTYSVGTVGSTDVDCEFIDFTYVCCSSAMLDSTIKREISCFSEQLRSNDNSSGSGQISLEFFQKKRNRWPFNAESIPWEVWTVRIELMNLFHEEERQLCRERVSEMLTDKILYITEVMNRHNYVPKMPNQSDLDLVFDTRYNDVQPYLFKFKYNTAGPTETSYGHAVKKLIKETFTL